jgi:hypothetical protein
VMDGIRCSTSIQPSSSSTRIGLIIFREKEIQQAGCMVQMDFPSETIGTPHVAFDSTGMVFTVMAEMAGGKGSVSTSTSTITANP